MPFQGDAVEYRVVLHRVGPTTGMFDAPGFSVLIRAKDEEDAVRQVEAIAYDGQFRVVNVYPANRPAGPAMPD